MPRNMTRSSKSAENLHGLLDDYDIGIITELRNDGRTPYRAIAEIVGTVGSRGQAAGETGW